MPIKRRQESNTGFYHVIVKGINNERIYNQKRERIYFKKIILKYLKKYQVEIFAFCIMSNHAHVIIRAELQELSMFMAVILAEYANYYNYKHKRNGHVFQNRFISECIENESYFWNCIRYVHMNPVKAGMVKNPLRYAYSSMKEYYTHTPLVLHENALVLYERHFAGYEVFEEFHQLRHYEVFKDIPEEISSQQIEVAALILDELSEMSDLKLKIQMFEEKHLRKKYMQQLQSILKLSDARTKKLYGVMKEITENG